MNAQESTVTKRGRQWIITAAGLLGASLFVFLLVRPEGGPAGAAEEGRAPSAASLAAPRLKGAPSDEPAVGGEGASPGEAAASCHSCEEKNRGGTCVKEMGCDTLGGEDRTLCENLVKCLRAHPTCRSEDPFVCYCGPAEGIECTQAPKGECLQEIFAAAKTTDPTEAGVRFYKWDFPVGRASQLIACDINVCKDHCATRTQ